MLSVDDGFFNGNFNLADLLFFLAAIAFAVAFVILATKPKPKPIDSALIAAGLTCLAVALLAL